MNKKPMYDGEQDSLEEYYTFIGTSIDDAIGTESISELKLANSESLYDPAVLEEEPERMVHTHTKLHFRSIAVITKEYHPRQGALLLELFNTRAKEYDKCWIPKVLCRNLDTKDSANTVSVLNKFVLDKLRNYV